MKHPNGGAEKVGIEVHVSADSFCNLGSNIVGASCVISSTLLNSQVRDSAIFESELDHTITTRSSLAKAVAMNASLSECVLHSTRVEGPRLLDVVAENCELYGNWTLEGNARIPTGIWHRAPRYKRITGENGVDIGLTESTDGYALMACWRKPTILWLKAGPRLGEKHRWTEKQINDARLFFTELLDAPLDGVRA